MSLLSEARERGLEILADTTPFNDGLGRMAAVLPSWLTDQTSEEAARLLGQPDVRERLRNDCDRYWRFMAKGEWHRVRLLNSHQSPELNGKDFLEIAEIKGTDPWGAFFDVLHEAGDRYGDIQMVGRLFTDEHLAEMISHPLISLGVDGMSSSTEPPLARILRHPVSYCGHIHYLTHHVREQRTLGLEEAIRKMTSMPATQFGLWDRGLLQPGFAADVVVFDFEALDDVSTLDDPVHYVDGVELVLVNGVETVRAGAHTGARAGRRLSAR
jgi:N-acyl-D-amino-acid deacylase